MQTCDFVKRNGRCADACRFWGVRCLDSYDQPDRDAFIESFLVGLCLISLIAIITLTVLP